MAMTAHIRFTAWDAERPATQSDYVIEKIIRRRIGFDGLLLTDDIDMEALDGTVPERSARAIAAGCDIVLNCWAKQPDMAGIVAALPAMSETTSKRLERALDGVGTVGDRTSREQLLESRESLLAIAGVPA